jgi:hypothetical protein
VTAPDILLPPMRGNLESLKAVSTTLEKVVLFFLASLEAQAADTYGEDCLGPMSLGRNFRRVRAALGDVASEVANLEDELEMEAVEDGERTQMREDERREVA